MLISKYVLRRPNFINPVFWYCLIVFVMRKFHGTRNVDELHWTWSSLPSITITFNGYWADKRQREMLSHHGNAIYSCLASRQMELLQCMVTVVQCPISNCTVVNIVYVNRCTLIYINVYFPVKDIYFCVPLQVRLYPLRSCRHPRPGVPSNCTRLILNREMKCSTRTARAAATSHSRGQDMTAQQDRAPTILENRYVWNYLQSTTTGTSIII